MIGFGDFAKGLFTRRTTAGQDEPRPQKTMDILGIPMTSLGVSAGARSQLLDSEEERKKKAQQTGEAASTLLGGTMLPDLVSTLFPAASNTLQTKRFPWQ